MRALVNGVEGKKVVINKATDTTLKLRLLNDDGSPFDTGAGTVDLIFYDTGDRKNTAIATIAATIATAAAGDCSVAISAAAANFGPGTYYAFARHTLTGVLTWGRKPTIVGVA